MPDFTGTESLLKSVKSLPEEGLCVYPDYYEIVIPSCLKKGGGVDVYTITDILCYVLRDI